MVKTGDGSSTETQDGFVINRISKGKVRMKIPVCGIEQDATSVLQSRRGVQKISPGWDWRFAGETGGYYEYIGYIIIWEIVCHPGFILQNRF